MEKGQSIESGRGRTGCGRGSHARRTSSIVRTPLGSPPAGHRFVAPQNATNLDPQ